MPSLVPGGAERIVSFIAQNLDREKFLPTLLIIGKREETAYNVENVETIYLEKDRVLKGIIPMFMHIRKHRPELVFTAIGHLNAAAGLLSIFFPKIKFVAREVNVSSVVKKYKKRRSTILGIAGKVGYQFIDMFICQSKDMLKDFIKNNKSLEGKVRLINNPITDGFELKKQQQSIDAEMRFITVASLKKQKGHIRILEALAKFNAPFKYTIVGDGSELGNIQKHINNLGLSKYVVHIPHTNEVAKYLANNDLFLQGSYVEGFPNCLLESCSVGTPVIAFNAPGGLDEIIEEGVNGFIANNEEEFISLLQKCRNGYDWNPTKVSISVTSKFNKEKILKKYENLFLEVLS